MTDLPDQPARDEVEDLTVRLGRWAEAMQSLGIMIVVVAVITGTVMAIYTDSGAENTRPLLWAGVGVAVVGLVHGVTLAFFAVWAQAWAGRRRS